jgi:hypothetical protein
MAGEGMSKQEQYVKTARLNKRLDEWLDANKDTVNFSQLCRAAVEAKMIEVEEKAKAEAI